MRPGPEHLGRYTASPLLLLFLLLSVQALPTFAAERIPAPTWMNTVLVAEEMVINGIPSHVYRFSADKSVQEVAAYYQKRWQRDEMGKEPGYSMVHSSPWLVISRIERKRYLLTVQIRQSGAFSSVGYLAQADLKRTQRNKGEDVPKLDGSKIVNDVTSHDPGQTGRTILLINHESITVNGDFYKKYYTSRNWDVLMDKAHKSGHVMFFRRGRNEVKIALQASGGSTQVVINWVTGE